MTLTEKHLQELVNERHADYVAEEKRNKKALWIYDKTKQGTAGNLRTVIRGTEEYCLKQAHSLYPNCLWGWEK